MRSLIVDLSISAEKYLRVYEGSAKHVIAYDRTGLRVQFPVGILRPYVSRDGIIGSFSIEFDKDNKFYSIKKI